MKKPEVYISTDVESDGPIPGPNSMLSLGSAAFNQEGNVIGTFEANLEQLTGAIPDPDTMEWWATQPEAWKNCRENLQDPINAMNNYVKWIATLPGTPVFVAYPASFDFMFIYWYLIKFTGASPFSFSALDIKSYASCLLNLPFRESTKKNMPKEWFSSEHKHSHVALDDAKEQGELFMNMLKARREQM